MTLKSMTGFSVCAGAVGDAVWRWEARSVNARGLDLRLRTPPGFDKLEPKLRRIAAGSLSRGAVTVSLTIETTADGSAVRIDERVLALYAAAAARLRAGLVAEGEDCAPLAVEPLLAMRGVAEVAERPPLDLDDPAILAALEDSFSGVITGLDAARAEEGARLSDMLTDHVSRIEALMRESARAATDMIEIMRARLKEQVAALMEAGAELDETRLAQELALLVVKADVREEVDRLRAHVAAARELLSASEPVGRRLDFLAQEFQREANTLCSKSASDALTQVGLDLKVVIDQLREQVQNVE